MNRPDAFLTTLTSRTSSTNARTRCLPRPLIFDLAILAELMTRITYREPAARPYFQPLYSVLSLLSYMLKAPLVKPGEDVVNSLNRQRNGLEMFLKACLGLEGSGDLLLKSRIW